MNKKKNLVFVWPIYTRIIHWLIASTFTISFILSLYEETLDLHVAFGIVFGLMLLYRFIWGFIGPRYATFNTFKLSLAQLKYFFIEKVRDRWREIPAGHNPASSWYTLIVLFLGSIISISGLLLYGVQEGKGYLGFLNDNHYSHMWILLDIHIYASYTLLTWAVIHITGVLIEQFYHKTNMIFAMISGYKKAKGSDSNAGKGHNIISYSFLIVSIMVFYVSTDGEHNPFVRTKFHLTDYKTDNPLSYEKCASCHNFYPPHILPAASWERVFKGMENHFGEAIGPNEKKEDNRISLNEQTIIKKYHIRNSAETTTQEVSVKVIKSVGENGRPLAFTKTPYFRETHADISNAVFKSKAVKDKSNCKACHKGFEQGLIDDRNIKIPTT